MIFAPIALFTYSRADHTRQAVESLLLNKEAAESDLYIFSDGPKTEEKREAVEENRRYIHSITGFKSIHIVEREKNWGLANSLIAGITDVVNRYGRVIVVEDDLILSPYFLQYMNEALEKYKDEDKVGAISGFVFPTTAPLPETFFLSYFHCWGWATWKRGWDLFSFDAASLYKQIKDSHREREFDFNYSYGYMDMLRGQINGSSNSWAVCWYASAFLKNKYTLYPGQSLVQLNDIDSLGSTHGLTPISYYVNVKQGPIIWDLVSDKIECEDGRKAIEIFFKSLRTWKYYIPTKIKIFIKKILNDKSQ